MLGIACASCQSKHLQRVEQHTRLAFIHHMEPRQNHCFRQRSVALLVSLTRNYLQNCSTSSRVLLGAQWKIAMVPQLWHILLVSFGESLQQQQQQ